MFATSCRQGPLLSASQAGHAREATELRVPAKERRVPDTRRGAPPEYRAGRRSARRERGAPGSNQLLRLEAPVFLDAEPDIRSPHDVLALHVGRSVEYFFLATRRPIRIDPFARALIVGE